MIPAFLAAATPSLIAGGASIISSILTNSAQKSAAQSAFDQQKDYSRWLLRNQTQEKVRDMRSAGLNPAFENGSQLGSTPSSPSYTPPSYSSPIDLSSALMFSKTSADTRLTNAQAKAQELLNADKEAKNKVLAHQYDDSVWLLDGKPISEEEVTKLLNTTSSDGSVKIPEFSIIPAVSEGAEGRFNAEQALKRWDKESGDINVGMLHNELDRLVTQGQINNPRVVQALQNMPYWTYKDIVQKVNNAVTSRENMKKEGKILDLNKAMIQLEYEIKRDSNLNQYIDKIFDSEFTIKDFTKLMVMSFVNLLKH